MKNRSLSWLAAAALSASTHAQDLLAIDTNGRTHRMDSRSGAVFGGAQLGITGVEAMARRDGTLFMTRRVTGGFNLLTMDPVTLSIAAVANVTQDVRGLAFLTTHILSELYGVDTTAQGNRLLRIDPSTAAVTVIGPLGFANVSALAFHQNTLFAWDTTVGLLTVDRFTGAATDVSPIVGAAFSVQFLTSMQDGRLLAGHNELYQVDPTRGRLTLIGSGPWSNVRGAEEFWGAAVTFGNGCQSTIGNASLTLPVPVRPNINLVPASVAHVPFGGGFLCIGGGVDSYLGNPLPFRVDAALGTVDCFLRVRPDITAFFVCDAVGRLPTPITIPGTFSGTSFFIQHVGLEGANVPGGISFSNGLELRVGF